MTKTTPDFSICFVFNSSPEAFISPLFFKKYFTLRGSDALSHYLACTWDFYLATPLQEYIAIDANNITLVFDLGNIVNISGNIFLYPPQGHPILYKYQSLVGSPVANINEQLKERA